jgi:hypothetical protein
MECILPEDVTLGTLVSKKGEKSDRESVLGHLWDLHTVHRNDNTRTHGVDH